MTNKETPEPQNVDWAGLNKILRGMRARNEHGSLELTNWIADNHTTTTQTPPTDVVSIKNEISDAIIKDEMLMTWDTWTEAIRQHVGKTLEHLTSKYDFIPKNNNGEIK